jgi:hypothetical protein
MNDKNKNNVNEISSDNIQASNHYKSIALKDVIWFSLVMLQFFLIFNMRSEINLHKHESLYANKIHKHNYSDSSHTHISREVKYKRGLNVEKIISFLELNTSHFQHSHQDLEEIIDDLKYEIDSKADDYHTH